MIEFDPAMNPVMVTGPEGNWARLSYDRVGRLVKMEEKSGESLHLSYLGESTLLAALAGPGGTQQTIEYDAAGNPLSLTLDGETIASLSYAPDGQLAHVAGRGVPSANSSMTTTAGLARSWTRSGSARVMNMTRRTGCNERSTRKAVLRLPI